MALDTRELFARLIQCEAGGEGEQGMAAVATVVMNRATATEGEFSRIGNGGDVRAVITQPGQFVCMRESVAGSYNPLTWVADNYQPKIVDWAMAGGRLVGIDNSLFFFNPYSDVCPQNFPTRVGVLHNRIGDHCFYAPTSYYADT